MTSDRLLRAGLLAATVFASAAQGAARIGEPAPDFSAVDSNGRTVKLADFAGRTVVMEWTNHGCPYVQKWYGGGMQALQKESIDKGAVWLTVLSSAPGMQGHVDGPTANRIMKDQGAAPTHYLLDYEGRIGRAYGAQVTPHMYVIAPDGRLAYMGGIDSIASPDVNDIPKAEPLTRMAIDAVLARKPVAKAQTRPYGCSIKYAH